MRIEKRQTTTRTTIEYGLPGTYEATNCAIFTHRQRGISCSPETIRLRTCPRRSCSPLRCTIALIHTSEFADAPSGAPPGSYVRWLRNSLDLRSEQGHFLASHPHSFKCDKFTVPISCVILLDIASWSVFVKACSLAYSRKFGFSSPLLVFGIVQTHGVTSS